MMSKAKLKATKETGLKILARKQLPQILPIAHAQVKAGNNSFLLCINRKKSLKKYIIT